MYALLITIHVFACICLIVAVLLQAGKGADIGAVFGGAGGQALFGSSGPVDFMNKATRVLVVVFMLTSFTLGFFALHRPAKSVMNSSPAPIGKTMPAAPGSPPASKVPANANNMVIPVAPVHPQAPAPAAK
jgi:preprotein translocase subunit SecG